jgi:hypothetical protein
MCRYFKHTCITEFHTQWMLRGSTIDQTAAICHSCYTVPIDGVSTFSWNRINQMLISDFEMVCVDVKLFRKAQQAALSLFISHGVGLFPVFF